MAKLNSDPKAYTFCETMAAYVWHIRKVGESGTHPSGAGKDKMTETLCGQQPAWDCTALEVDKLTGADQAHRMTGRRCSECWVRYIRVTKRWERT